MRRSNRGSDCTSNQLIFKGAICDEVKERSLVSQMSRQYQPLTVLQKYETKFIFAPTIHWPSHTKEFA